MKKFSTIVLISLLSSVVFLLGFQNKNTDEPNTYYQVYLDDQVLGTIKSKNKLEKYIDKKGEYIKEKYDVSTIYAPNGLEIRKRTTYEGELSEVKEVYEKLEQLKPFTIEGYQFSIKSDDDAEIIYVTEKDIFEQALINTVTTFVGTESYQLYMNDEQVKIETTGTIIDNVYIDETITIKKVKIPVNEVIYSDVSSLTQYLLFGENYEPKTYTVKLGDTIETVSYNNKINIEEFLIANPEFSSADNLLYPGQVVSIGIVNPRLSVVVETTTVKDQETEIRVDEKKDPNMVIGEEKIIQNGEPGLERVTIRTKKINGATDMVEPLGKEELKPMIPKIVLVGSKYLSNVGGPYWSWPTESGWVITSNYAWRYNPVTGAREHHQALDIAGPGFWSDIYAVNNGTVMAIQTGQYNNLGSTGLASYGNYVIINHNNGYYTLYAHMSAVNTRVGATVERGQVIGYMGSTGNSTGPHLHLEVWVGGKPWGGGTNVNPCKSIFWC